MSEKLQWKCHTPNLLKEIALINTKGLGTMYHPINIFREILVQLADRCAELNDPELNALMCRLTLYDIADPESKDYNSKQVSEILKLAKDIKHKEARE